MTWTDRGVEANGDEVAKAVDGGAEEVEAWAEIGDRGRGEGLHGGEDGLGLCGDGGGKRGFASKDGGFFG